jgi:hypothetical protein
MSERKATDDEIRAAWLKHEGRTTRMAIELGMSPRRMRARAAAMGLPPSQPGPRPELGEIDRPTPTVQQARTEQRLRDEITDLRRQLLEERRELARSEDLRGALFRLAEQPIGSPKWTATPKAAKTRDGKVPTMPILLTSDFQWGEKISAEELDGVNGFDMKVASQRYQRLISATIEIAQEHMGGKHAYPGIYYLRGGDAISGDIHQELRETNDLQSIPAVRSLVEHESEGIRRLANAFGKVHVVSVPGNHGRTTIKPHSKRYVETNYDTLSAWWLESRFAGDARVTWQTPVSGDALFNVYGWQWLLTHGDRIGSRGGHGFVGPSATIARGMKRLVEYYATLGTRVDTILLGHFHQRMELPWGFCNGCLPGYSEYARDNRLHPSEPSQWLLFCHPKHGITARWPILLAERPRVAVQEKVAA